jgi:molybdopterin-dependent oxidoreductase alpha subunit
MSTFVSPEKFSALKHYPRIPTVAVGMQSIVSGSKHVWQNMRLADGIKILSKLNQKNGIDCPSCAWGDPDGHRSSMAEYCENGIKAIADEATRFVADDSVFTKFSVEQLAAFSDYELGKLGRLALPMILRSGKTHYERIEWEEVFLILANHLNSLSSPDEAIFYTSGRSSNEAAFLYQLFVREFGTNNLPDCSNLCHESSGVALNETLGLGKGSVTLDDFEKAEVIIIMGQNPGTNHPRMLSSLELAKKNGATIVSINPLKEPGLVAFKNPQKIGGILGGGTTLTNLYLQVRINGDLALLKAVMKRLLEEEEKSPGTVLDDEFINTNTNGFEFLKEDLKNYSYELLIKDCGLSAEEVEAFVRVLVRKRRIIVCWAMGITQHQNAVYTIREITNLLLLKGSIGKPGSGVCPVRGHSNVQGDRTMGISNLLPQKVAERIAELYGFRTPEHRGYDVVASIQAMYEKRARIFFSLGGNLLAAAPDTAYTAQAFKNCDLTVQVSTKLNRSHLVTGKTGLILPCLGRTDRDEQEGKVQFVSTENSMGVVQKSQGVLKPKGNQMKSEPWIVAQMAHAVLGHKSKIEWNKLAVNYDLIRDMIAQTIDGFADLNNKVQVMGGFYLPNGPREGRFTTASGKAHFTVNNWNKIDLKENELLMMTIRSHDQFNTTIYGMDDRYRGIYQERRVIFMNVEDMRRLKLMGYQVVDIVSSYDDVERIASKFKVIEYDIPKGCCATYFPESNPVVPINMFAEKSRTPISKSVVIRLKVSN